MTLLEVRLAPSPWNARTVRDHLVRIGATMQMHPERLEEFVTAVSEAFANAVEHANTEMPVEIAVKLDRKRQLFATVRDYGRGIDAASISNALPPAVAERGRGIPLMRRCSSTMSISVPAGGGTLVALSWAKEVAGCVGQRATRRSPTG